jgi:transcriptional regulator with XRE-family HTH domain
VDQSRVSRWEQGERVDARRVEQLAGWLGWSVDGVLALNYLGVSEGAAQPLDEIAQIVVDDLDELHQLVDAAAFLGFGVRVWNVTVAVEEHGWRYQWHLSVLSEVPSERR